MDKKIQKALKRLKTDILEESGTSPTFLEDLKTLIKDYEWQKSQNEAITKPRIKRLSNQISLDMTDGFGRLRGDGSVEIYWGIVDFLEDHGLILKEENE